MDLKEIDILGDKISAHWYYASKALALKDLLKDISYQTILDVGAGSAFFSRYLLEHSAAQEAWCIDISYGEDHNETCAGKPLYFRREVKSIPADLVLMMDVLEHVDDLELLNDYMQKVSHKSKFLISVPAFQFLWSNHDIFLGHQRRYTLKKLENTLQKSGLTILHSNYFFTAVFPIAAATRLWQNILPQKEIKSQLKQHHPLINSALATACKLEIPLQKHNKLFGLTVFCLAEKSN